MKILDRYVLGSFLKNYLIAFFVLLGLRIVLDMLFNFDELVEVREADKTAGLMAVLNFIAYVVDFYFYQTFLYFVHVSGMIPVVAASFTIIRMVRFNELSALLSAGVPLLRVSLSIIVAGVLLQGLVLIDQEFLIPEIIPKLARKHDYGAEKDKRAFRIQAMLADDNSKVWGSRFFPHANPPRMEVVDVVYQDDKARPVKHIKADSAVWDPVNSQWNLVNGIETTNLIPESTIGVESRPVETLATSVTPTEISLYRSGSYVDLLSLRDIDRLLERPRSYGRGDLLRVKHARWASLIVNIVMLLLTIACVLTREPQQLKTAATWAALTGVACTATSFLGQQLAGSPPGGAPAMWPALMNWLPIFIFFPLSVLLLDRVKT